MSVRLNGAEVSEHRLRPGQRGLVGDGPDALVPLPGGGFPLYEVPGGWSCGEAVLAPGASHTLRRGIITLRFEHVLRFTGGGGSWRDVIDLRMVALLALCLALGTSVSVASANWDPARPVATQSNPFLRYLDAVADPAVALDEAGSARARYAARDFAGAAAAWAAQGDVLGAARAARRAGELDQVRRLGPDASAALRGEAALAALAAGSPAEAQALLDAALAAGLADPVADRIEAQALAQAGDLRGARRLLQRAIAAWPQDPADEQLELYLDLATAPAFEALRADGSIEQILQVEGLAVNPLRDIGFLP